MALKVTVTPTIPVVWRNYLAGVQARGFWDQSFLEWLFAQDMPGGYRFAHSETFPGDIAEGVVLVVPGHHRNNDQLNEDIRGRPWVLLIITSDEEGDCPFWGIHHPNISIWKHTPRAELPWQPDRALALGWTPGTVEANIERPEKPDDWFFAGQITHGRREQARDAMRTMGGGKLVETSTFASGMAQSEYRDMMRRAKVVPCPSGPNIPDTFRLYEALEAGAVPLADATCPRGDWGYWHRVFPLPPAFPIVEDWSQMPLLVEEWKSQPKRVRVLGWWEHCKRDLLWRLHDDIRNLGAPLGKPPIGERITVLVPTSPIPSHPSTDIIRHTLESIRSRLPLSEIVVMADGVRPELEHRREQYEDYLESLVWLCRKHRAVPLIFDVHTHQVGMTRKALDLVRTDMVLFVEHDTPLAGYIPFDRLGEIVMMDDIRVVRFHHEERVPREHKYLMRGPVSYPYEPDRLTFDRTVQWSQRPHLTTTQNYRKLLATFSPQANSMIEDGLYGAVANAEWEEFKVGIYKPAGSIRRSLHLDGRGSDSKYPDSFTF